MRRLVHGRFAACAVAALAAILSLAGTTRSADGLRHGGLDNDGSAAAPVVLLHGWHGSGASGVERTSLSVLARRLADDGYPVYWASGVGADRSDTVYDSARRLADIVTNVSGRHEGAGVAVVAHSYGGIVARALIESDLYAPVIERGGRVASLVTLGTPMAGVDMWLPFVFVLGDPHAEPSVWELTPAFMHAFNQAHRPNPDVHYTLVAGDARSQSWILRLLPPSDGVVSVASAHALCGSCYSLVEVVTDDFHAPHSVAKNLGWHTYLDAPTTYQETVLAAVEGGRTSAAPPSSAQGSEVHRALKRPMLHRPIELTAQARESLVGLPGIVAMGGSNADEDQNIALGDTVADLTGGPATVAALQITSADMDALGLDVSASPGVLRVVVRSSPRHAGSEWAELLWRGGSQILLQPADRSSGSQPVASSFRADTRSLAPGYYLIRAGADANDGPVETETVVVVPFLDEDRPAAIREAGVRDSVVTTVVDVVRPGQYVVSYGPLDPTRPSLSCASGTTVRHLPTGRHVVTTRLAEIGTPQRPTGLRWTRAVVADECRLQVFKADQGLMVTDEARIANGRIVR